MPTRRSGLWNRQIRVIRKSISRIDRALGHLTAFVRDTEKARKALAKAPRRKLRLSPRRRAALKLQGRYMGYLRQLNSRQKARVKGLKAKRGFQAAINVAKRLAGK